MAKPNWIELPTGQRILILYEDRSVLVIDKPPGWMLAPSSWHKRSGNLQRALEASIKAGDFWARLRNLDYLRFAHRLDAGTSGILVLAKTPGALGALGALFQGRQVAKLYLAVVRGVPAQTQWSCGLKLAPDRANPGKMRVAPERGKEATTQFRLLQAGQGTALLEARPFTGRTHQIRVHLAACGHPVVGDGLYGPVPDRPAQLQLGLRAAGLAYTDPFTHRPVRIRAPVEEFARQYGFQPPDAAALILEPATSANR